MTSFQEPAPLSPSYGGERLASKILMGSRVRREIFDPTNLEHLQSYRTYLTTGNWGDVQFYYENPFATVPATVNYKFAIAALNSTLGDGNVN
jgi:hypothetical protein